MRYTVNEQCIGCGLCESICPEVFRLDSGLATAQDIEVSDDLQDAAQEACNSCPVNAIEEG